MKTTQLDLDACPFCGTKLNAATATPGEDPDATPDPGDVTVCIQCASILIFAQSRRGGLKLRMPTEQELAEALTNPNTLKTVQAVEALRMRPRQ